MTALTVSTSSTLLLPTTECLSKQDGRRPTQLRLTPSKCTSFTYASSSSSHVIGNARIAKRCLCVVKWKRVQKEESACRYNAHVGYLLSAVTSPFQSSNAEKEAQLTLAGHLLNGCGPRKSEAAAEEESFAELCCCESTECVASI